MNERRRFLETILFGRPDRVPFQPGGPRESTLKAWRQQGLPDGVHWMDHLRGLLGIEPPPAIERPQPHVDFRMIPQFEEKVLERRPATLIVQDWKGNVCEISDQFGPRHLRQAIDFVTRRWIRCPVQTRDDWELMKRRYDPAEPARFDQDPQSLGRRLADRQHVVTVSFPGPFWQMREWCGFEGLCMLFLDEPDWVAEMVAFWRDFVSAVLEKLLRHVVPDHVFISEDMAYKHKPMISPAMARQFLLPCWSQWCRQLRAAGVPVIDMDSDGYIPDLIPLWIEAGFNCCNPIEVAAGNDIVAMRRRFGRAMAYHGGIDKRAMAAGPAAVRREIDRVAPVVRDGGYIPGCDHGVPADVSWPNFVEYARMLAELTGWL